MGWRPLTGRRWLWKTVGRRSTNQALQRREPERRYPILLTVVSQSAVDLLDEVVALFDQAVSARESRAKAKTAEALAERAKKGEVRQLLLEMILPVLADPAIPDEQGSISAHASAETTPTRTMSTTMPCSARISVRHGLG